MFITHIEEFWIRMQTREPKVGATVNAFLQCIFVIITKIVLK